MNRSTSHNISTILTHISKKLSNKKSISFQSIINELGDHAFGLIMILFALPNLLPLSVVPGFSTLFGLPIIFVALHLIIGKHTLWLPSFLGHKKIDSQKLESMIQATLPYLRKLEKVLQPRFLFMTSKFLDRIHGLVLLCLSILLTLPIPFSNFIFATGIILFGLGIAEEDGLIIIIVYLGLFSLLVLFTQLTELALKFF